MNKYELTVVLPGKSTPAKKKSELEKIEKNIKLLKGSVSKVDDWGKLDLSYKIKGNDGGVFILFTVELNSDTVKKLSDTLKMEEDILRFLIVKI